MSRPAPSEELQPRTVRQRAAFLEQLKKMPVIQAAAEKVGTGRATVYNWRQRDRRFAEKMDKALVEGKLHWNDVSEVQLMASIRDRNLPAVMFWLKHHHPDYATKVEISATVRDEYELTPEQKAVVREALRLATLPKIGGMLSKADPEAKIEPSA